MRLMYFTTCLSKTLGKNNSFIEVISAISDFGVLLVIGGIVIIFLYKVLNNSIKQTEMLTNNVSVTLNSIMEASRANQAVLIESINSHNSSMNNMITRLEKNVDELRATVDIMRMLLNEVEDRTITIDNRLTAYLQELNVLPKNEAVSSELQNNTVA